MDYTTLSKKTSMSIKAVDGNYVYTTSYAYDADGNITGLACNVNKTVDSTTTYLGTMSIVDSNGYQNVNLSGEADLATHVTNFETIVTKIKADVATAIGSATTAS
jgi:hypothetical protein